MLIPALLAGLAVAVLVGLPAPGRLANVLPAGPRPARGDPGDAWRGHTGPGLSLQALGKAGSVGRRIAPFLVGGAALLPLGPAGALVAMVLTAVGRRALRHRREAAAREAERAGAVEACAVLAAELHAGRGPAEALAAAATVATGPAAAALAKAATGVRFGADVPGVLVAAAGGSAVPDLLRGLAACWLVCSATGAGLATSVERLAEGLRAAHAQRREVEAELAGPQATAVLLALLPVAGTALAAGLGARPLEVLLHTPAGGVCLLLGVALDLAGLWWTGRLVASAGGAR